MDISIVLTKNYSDCLWELHGFEYDGLVWLDESPKPSQQELEAQYHQVFFEIEYKKVQEARRQQYTVLADPLFFGFQRGENTEQEWLDAVQAVKDANPFPQK